ncbi:MAG: hypothetical protein AVDCRST_MAG89-3228, partial [uncultured Gemmatimonadetes bacterium]
ERTTGVAALLQHGRRGAARGRRNGRDRRGVRPVGRCPLGRWQAGGSGPARPHHLGGGARVAGV